MEDVPNTLSTSNLLQLPRLSTERTPSSSVSGLTTTAAADPDIGTEIGDKINPALGFIVQWTQPTLLLL